MDDADVIDLLDHLTRADEALREARTALRMAQRLAQGGPPQLGIPLSADEAAKIAEAHRMHEVMGTVLDLIAGMMGNERRWVTTAQVLLAAHAAGVTELDTHAALAQLSRSGGVYNAGGKDTWAPMRT